LADSNISVAEFFHGKLADENYVNWANKMSKKFVNITGVSCHEKLDAKKYCTITFVEALQIAENFASIYDFHLLKMRIAGTEVVTDAGFEVEENAIDDLIAKSKPVKE